MIQDIMIIIGSLCFKIQCCLGNCISINVMEEAVIGKLLVQCLMEGNILTWWHMMTLRMLLVVNGQLQKVSTFLFKVKRQPYHKVVEDTGLVRN